MKKYICNKAECIIFYILLVVTTLWNFLFLNKGIDITDAGYYLTKYKYYFSADVNVQSMGTFLTDLLGSGIYRAFDSGQVLVLSICHWALYMGSGVMVYQCLKKYVPRLLLLTGILGGSLFSLTWVHIMNYNTTSMFVQTAAICILIKGIEREQSKYYIISGVLFGINTFFRLPNILQICIGGGILWCFIFCKKNLRKSLCQFLWYVAGVSVGWASTGALALVMLGKDSLFTYLFNTANMAGSSDTSHGMFNMLSALYNGAKLGVKDWIRFFGLLLVVLIVWNCILRKQGFFKRKEKAVHRILVVLFVLYGIYVGGFLEYARFNRMIGVCIIGVVFAGAVYYRKTNTFVSAVCMITFCAEAVLCIGTDNAWNYQIVFLIFPFCVCLLIIAQCEERHLKQGLILCAIFAGGLSFAVGARYATQYVYRDAPNSELRYAIAAKEYRGIYTSKDRAQYLDELETVLEPLEGQRLLAYGDLNIGYIVTDMKPFFDKVWSDLQSYPVEQFESDLQTGLQQRGYPVILLADTDQNGVYHDMEKLELLTNVIQTHNYKKYYENEWYCIYVRSGQTT